MFTLYTIKLSYTSAVVVVVVDFVRKLIQIIHCVCASRRVASHSKFPELDDFYGHYRIVSNSFELRLNLRIGEFIMRRTTTCTMGKQKKNPLREHIS